MQNLYKKDLLIKAIIDNKVTKIINVILEELIDHKCKLTIVLDNQVDVIRDNFFECLSVFKRNHSNVILFCKGYKVNVYPSRMTLQMGMGLKAYEVNLGSQATFDNLVDIFEYEENNLTSSVKLQEEFHFKWLNSLSSK